MPRRHNQGMLATLQAIQHMACDATNGAVSFTWADLAETASTLSGQHVSADLAYWYVLDLHRNSRIRIEYADERRAAGVTVKRRLR